MAEVKNPACKLTDAEKDEINAANEELHAAVEAEQAAELNARHGDTYARAEHHRAVDRVTVAQQKVAAVNKKYGERVGAQQ